MGAKKRQDFCGFGDLIAYSTSETHIIQATSTPNMNSRVTKILDIPAAADWLREMNRKIVVIGWKKYTKPVEGKWWRPTERYLTIEDFA